MKTAISIPDAIFKTADQVAQRLGMSRSELYVNAVREYLERNKPLNITATLNKVYGDTESSLDQALTALQMKTLGREDW